jgi:hypothetical protein
MADKKDGRALTRDADPRRRYWLEESAAAFAAQAGWQARYPHPLSDIIVEPGKPS